MIKKYKNAFVTEVNSLDLNMENFILEYQDESNVVHGYRQIELLHKESGFRFLLRNNESDWNEFDCVYTTFKPGFPEDFFPREGWTNFEECTNRLKAWVSGDLEEFLIENEQPDYLEILSQKENLLSVENIEFNKNTPFNAEELKSVQLGMRELRILIEKEFEFTKEELKYIDNRLKYIEESAQRLGRIDWKNILIASIPAIIIALSLDTEKGQKLLDLFSKILQSLTLLEF